MAASGTGPLVFIDDSTADKSGRMNAEVHMAVLSAQIPPNNAKLIGHINDRQNCESNLMAKKKI